MIDYVWQARRTAEVLKLRKLAGATLRTERKSRQQTEVTLGMRIMTPCGCYLVSNWKWFDSRPMIVHDQCLRCFHGQPVSRPTLCLSRTSAVQCAVPTAGGAGSTVLHVVAESLVSSSSDQAMSSPCTSMPHQSFVSSAIDRHFFGVGKNFDFTFSCIHLAHRNERKKAEEREGPGRCALTSFINMTIWLLWLDQNCPF